MLSVTIISTQLRQILDGVLTSIRLQFSHPSRNQMKNARSRSSMRSLLASRSTESQMSVTRAPCSNKHLVPKRNSQIKLLSKNIPEVFQSEKYFAYFLQRFPYLWIRIVSWGWELVLLKVTSQVACSGAVQFSANEKINLPSAKNYKMKI